MWNRVLYGKSGMRRPVVSAQRYQPDAQGAIPAGWCEKCGAEVFAQDAELCERCEELERRVRMRKPSPCLYCTRVEDPDDCENKKCRQWREWFVERWEQLRSMPRLQCEAEAVQKLGVCVGGQVYAAPNQIEYYLRKDPCTQCLCPKDLCSEPCRLKRAWEEARNEVYL